MVVNALKMAGEVHKHPPSPGTALTQAAFVIAGIQFIDELIRLSAEAPDGDTPERQKERANLALAGSCLNGFAARFERFRRAELILRLRQIFVDGTPAFDWRQPRAADENMPGSNCLGSVGVSCVDTPEERFDVIMSVVAVAMRFAGEDYRILDEWRMPHRLGVDTDYYPPLVAAGPGGVQ